MAFPLGGLISAGGALLGGLLGDSAAEKESKRQRQAILAANKRAEAREDTRIQRVVADANKAGIHPLAALGSPTVGSFATPQAVYGGAPISGSAIGDALSKFGEAMPVEGSNDGLQAQLLKAQIRNVDASTMQLLADATSRSKIGSVQQTGTAWRFLGQDFTPNPAFSDAQVLQNRLGEPAEWAAFPFIAGADVARWLGESARRKVEGARAAVQAEMRKRGVTPR